MSIIHTLKQTNPPKIQIYFVRLLSKNAAFVIPSLSLHLCPSLTSLPLFISPISAPLSSALFAVTFHVVI